MRGLGVLGSVAGAVVWAAAAAQPVAPPTREQVTRGEQPDAAPEARRPRLRVEDRIERAPCPLADPRFESVRVNLSAVSFDGLKAGIDAELLRPAYADYLGREQPIAVVCEVRDRAATILRRRGYLAAIQVPAQRIADGRVRFDVLLAKLAAIRVRGNAGRSDTLVASLLQPLTREPVFNERDAERRLLLARDLPGFDIRLTLRPGERPGEVIGDVTVIRTPLLADANVQNFGSQEVGRWGGTVRAQLNGLTGLGDSTTVSYFNTTDIDEQHVLTGAHSFLLGASGVGVGGSLTYAWTKPDVQGLDVDSRTLIGAVSLNYPMLRSRAATVRLAGGLDIVDQTVDVAGLRLSTDRLRVPFVRLEGEAIAPRSVTGQDGLSIATPRWRLGGTLELRHGIDALGASRGCGRNLVRCQAGAIGPSRAFGNPTAFVARAGAQGEYRPISALTLVAATRAQYAPDPLLSFEEFSAGNYTIGRGYDPGAIIGDSGVGWSLELRAGRPFPTGPLRPFVQPYAFVDAVWVWNNDPPAGRPAGSDPQTVSSFGLGARGGLGDLARFDLVAAIPVHRVLSTEGGLPRLERQPVRFLISISSRLWPWRRG